MANQRREGKKQIGGYVDGVIIQALDGMPHGKTQFFEECVIRGLLKRRELTKDQIIELHERKAIHPKTFAQLRAEKLI